MKNLFLLKAYIIYAVTCVAIIVLYLYSTVNKENAEILGQTKPLISQYYDLGTVAMMGLGLNICYYLYTKKLSKTASLIHLILAILLGIFVILGQVNMAK